MLHIKLRFFLNLLDLNSRKMQFSFFGYILPAINYAVTGYKMLFPFKRLHRGISSCIVLVG